MRDKKEIFGVRHPAENMKCKTCKFAHGEPPYQDTWRKCSCMKYPYPDETKPTDVYFDGADCEFYERG